jgi:hypothetical protein
MIIDSNNMMIGKADHIREVGPHSHVWIDVGRDGAGFMYRECQVCGTRTTDSPEFITALRRDWLAGGEWKVPQEKQVVIPASFEEAEEVHREAMEEQADNEADKDENPAPRRRGRPPKNR